MARILIPLPKQDFDPTEVAIPWLTLTNKGHEVYFATPDGEMAMVDKKMIDGAGLGIWKSVLRADSNGRAAYAEMLNAPHFNNPWTYERAASESLDGLILPGGHASGMREYLESTELQKIVSWAFEKNIVVGAICHGVIVAARTKQKNGRSVLFGKKTTALTRSQELTAWGLTALWLGNYYRTYPETVQGEVTDVLEKPSDFITGPLAVLRDSPERLERGFIVRDGNYLSARWPGDVHRFANEYEQLLIEQNGKTGVANNAN